jgi:signal transduction histidine kinase
MLTPAFKHHAASIRVNCPDNISLHSYPGALSQVITNIISNAYIHAFAHQHKGLIRLDASMLTTEQVQIIISDNGRGIAAEDLPKIFDPFFTSRLGQGGSGLGLHICYNLICGPLHGAIVVESEPDRGSRFTLTLPRQL